MKAKKRAVKRRPSGYMELYKAVEKYVSARGGSIVVIGGIQIIQWPGDSEYKFTVGIQCLGKKPRYSSKEPK